MVHADMGFDCPRKLNIVFLFKSGFKELRHIIINHDEGVSQHVSIPATVTMLLAPIGVKYLGV
jgi:hypothetical protein